MKSKISKTFIIVMAVWTIITLLRVAFHQPWYDEAHSWLIARDYSFIDMIAQAKFEGQPFIWYSLLMPFAKNDLGYPISMMLINWLFSFVAMIVFWTKAPFNNITKIIVTFSYPFFAQFPCVARCYAIGLMFLFLLAAMYKNSIKHPVLYSICLGLCVNTSTMAIYGGTAFGILFLIDMVKGALSGTVSKKNFILSFSILAVAGVLLLWALIGANPAHMYFEPMNDSVKFLSNIRYFLFLEDSIFLDVTTAIGLLSVLILLPLYFWKNKRVLFFYLFSFYGIISVFLFKYYGYPHNYVFFYVYIIIALWLMQTLEAKNTKLALTVEITICLLFVGQLVAFNKSQLVYFTSASKYFYNEVVSIPNVENSRIILFYPLDTRIVPYDKERKLDIYIYSPATKVTGDATLYESILTKGAVLKYLLPTWLHRSVSPDKTNYAIVQLDTKNKANGFILEDRYYKDIFEPYKIINETFGIFKLTEIKK